jgi:immune inhibitor A
VASYVKMTNSSAWIVIVAVVILFCCGCLLLLGGGALVLYRYGLTVGNPLALFVPGTATPPVTVTRPPVGAGAERTLSLLENIVVPENDLPDLACRLQDRCNLPLTVAPPKQPYQVGAQEKFWVTNVDTNENFQVDATLRYITPHVYFWVQDGVRYQEDDLKALAETFESKIYPTDREFFGSEWTPGVDGDPHIYILYARGLGYSLAGYFSSADEYTPQVHKYSNAHEMFLFNADNMSLSSPETYGTLAHEFQHMIHWYQDRNETSWINEGFSVLAEFLNGYSVGFDHLFMLNPDLQLTDWSPDPGANGPHYGASFLFLNYFLNRFGDKATQALVKDPENGLVSVDDTLKQIGATDPQTGQPIKADDIFSDWVVTNYVDDSSVGDGRYVYQNYAQAPQARPTETISNCPHSESDRVHQYGADYIRITCSGDYNLHFEGSTVTGLLPADPHSGDFVFWSNKGDESDMTLTHSFDFSGRSGPITLDYWAWYDVEKDYDYVYVETSTDGKQWQLVRTPSCTTDDPSGNSYGCAYNAMSGGGSSAQWIQQQVDLSQYAGQTVQVRFEYVTDAAVNGEGFMLDDVSIPAIGYQADFENGDGGWQTQGFARVENVLPQTFRLALILQGRTTTVQRLPLTADQTADVQLRLGGDVRSATLAVSGTTRFTREQATYSIEIK